MSNSPAAPTIRPALPSDAVWLDALRSTVLAYHHAVRPDLFREEPLAPDHGPAPVDARTDLFVLVAEIGTTVVGFIEAYAHIDANHPILADRRAMRIDTLVVDEAWRGKGIGRALVTEIERIAGERGFPEIELNVYAFNEAAKGLYGSLGYEPLNVRLVKKTA